ncbi:MAG: SgcJ/EcaC family oxidoreductase [Novosphingobium sp.]|nr:SgcJ/EcaC family oxidoreductase [Novosphingobium sp.]MBO9602317.1 SgcJ/EcaC family oxidoreductase [Novosphingobium sp.]
MALYVKLSRPEDLPQAFAEAWNAHDMDAFAALFHHDASFVNRFGHYVHGIDAIVAMHRPIHETVYRDSSLMNEPLDLVPLGDHAAVMHFWSRLTVGGSHPAGAHMVDTLIQAVLMQREGTWRVQALENVTLADPRTGQAVLRD